MSETDGPASLPTAKRLLVVVAVALLAHLSALGCGWIWDDDSYVTANPVLSSADGYLEVFRPGSTPQYYPLVFLGFWIEHALVGDEPLAYHLANVLMHAANAALLLAVLVRLQVPRAWWIALLFAAHPMGVESVAWVTERKNVQSMMFALASISMYLSMLDARRDRILGSWLASLALFVCALLSKTTAIFVPPCIVLALLWMRRRVGPLEMVRIAPFFAAGIAAGLFTAHVEKTIVGATGNDFTLSLIERLQLSGRTALFYATAFAFPREQIFIYPRFATDASIASAWIPFASCAVALVVCIARWRKDRSPLLIFLWYGAALFPALGFFDVWPFRYSFVADHFAYAAMPVLAVVFVTAAHLILQRIPKRVGIIIASSAIAACIALSWNATAKYEDERTLWIDTAERNPSAWIAHNNLATIHLADAEQGLAAGDASLVREAAEDALASARRAGELKPDEFTNAVNRSEALRLLGRDDEALAEIDAAIALAPRLARIHWVRARLLERIGRVDDARAALGTCAELGRGGADEQRARLDLMRMAVASGNQAAAMNECRRLIEIDPEDADSLANLGALLAANGAAEEGRVMLLRALRSERGLASEQAAVNALVRYLRLAIDANISADEVRDADRFAQALVARSGNDPSARYLALALRLVHGDTFARVEIESIERDARASGATQLADDIGAFLARHPRTPR